MILVDTSVWIDHLRSGEPALATALEGGQVLDAPVRARASWPVATSRTVEKVLRLLGDLAAAPTATESEVRDFIERRALMGRGIGYIDVHVLASTVTGGIRRTVVDPRPALCNGGRGT